MRSSHTPAAVDAVFDEENLIKYGGLEPVVRLAQRCGLPDLVDQRVRITGAANSAGANPAAKVVSLVAGMTTGADSIDDMDQLRHGGMALLFTGVRAPSTVGTFLRSFTHGHNRQLHAVHRQFLLGSRGSSSRAKKADAAFRISLARLSSRTSRSSSAMRCASAVEIPGLCPPPISA